MKLSSESYYSREANAEYMSVSQVKDFMRCEASALAKLRGEYEEPESTALLVGSYVDRYFEGTLDGFKAEHPEIFMKSGDLKADYRRAEQIIRRIEQDDVFMSYMSGEKQHIVTGEIFGYRWKGKIDSLTSGAIVDLKVMRSLEPVWVPDMGRMHFIDAWGYDIQGAIYQELIYQETGKRLPFIIAAATKEEVPDIGLFYIPQKKLDDAMNLVGANIDRIADLKEGLEEPARCDACSYCKQTKKLERPIDYTEVTI